MVPLRVDPTTGVRIPVVPPPPGFQPAVDGLSSGPPNFLQWLAGLLCHHPAEPPEGSRADHAQTPVPATRQRLSPIDIRQPNFDDDAADGAVGSQLCILSTKTLTSLKTKLELADINNWITDFMAAFGRLHDNTAHILLTTPDWRAVLVGGHPSMIGANKSIATCVFACLDETGPNVKRLKSKLRTADRTDRSGILFSGMDILEEIAALVTERSLGEIKLNATTEKPVLKAGASLDETRLLAEDIQKNFILKTDAERAVPNALHHEIIDYMPDSSPILKIKKDEYQTKLFKSEMHKESAPWTLDELIDEIAVDLARASPAKEASAADRPPFPQRPPAELHPLTRCASCGATGKHLSRVCPVQCPKCNLNFCPGNRGMVCAIECVEQPSTRSLKNFLGGNLHAYLVNKLDTAWSAKHGKAIQEVSAAELCQVIEDDDEEEHELCSTVGPIGLCNPGT